MYHIELTINDQVLIQLLTFLESLGDNQQLIHVSRNVSPPQKSRLAPNDPLQKWVKPLRKKITVDELIAKHPHKRRTRAELEQLFLQMNLEQPLELLLNDLKL